MANILKKLFAFGNRINKNNPWIKKFYLWKKLVQPNWIRIRILSGNMPCAEGGFKYFKYNTERVNRVADFFCDEESKRHFLGMIKFRQTGKKTDHVCCDNSIQYFINDFFTYGKNEVLIDCGASIGDTIEVFLKLQNMKYEQIVAFEPFIMRFKVLENKFAADDKFILINAGTYSKDCELFLTKTKISETPLGAKDETKIAVKAIDNLQNLKKVTFIKMDIEGAEMEALKGARKTILLDKPKLAICIYHSNEDMLRIAEWIHDLVPEYKLYCRHHKGYPDISETVLYAQIIGNI